MSNFHAGVSLLTDQDRDDDGNGEAAVTLMTVHAAKGLEFKNVIIVGVEENLFPSAMSSDSIAGIEEERRLLYVAITRAQVTCTITYARSRYRNGQTQTCTASRFIRDMDSRYLSVSSSSTSYTKKEEPKSQFRWENGRLSKIGDDAKPREQFRIKQEPTRRPAVSQPAADNGDFGLHEVSELYQGMAIEHSRFGAGTIISIETGGSADAKIIVDFGDIGIKTLILKFARFKIM